MADIPCVSLPELSGDLRVSLPMGISLQGFGDFSQGAPSDCTAMFSLLGQLSPALGSLSPLLKILKVLGALLGFMQAIPSLNPIDIGKKAAEVIEALGGLATLIAAVTPVQVGITVAGTLNLVINFLDCFIKELKAIIKVQADINAQLQVAADNPALSLSLSCAKANVELSQKNLMASLGPIQPVLLMVKTLEDFVPIKPGLPDILSIASNPDAEQVINDVEQAIDLMKQVISNLPK